MGEKEEGKWGGGGRFQMKETGGEKGGILGR